MVHTRSANRPPPAAWTHCELPQNGQQYVLVEPQAPVDQQALRIEQSLQNLQPAPVEQASDEEQPASVEEQPASVEEQPASNEEQPASNEEQQQTSDEEQPASNDEQQAAGLEQPMEHDEPQHDEPHHAEPQDEQRPPSSAEMISGDDSAGSTKKTVIIIPDSDDDANEDPRPKRRRVSTHSHHSGQSENGFLYVQNEQVFKNCTLQSLHEVQRSVNDIIEYLMLLMSESPYNKYDSTTLQYNIIV